MSGFSDAFAALKNVMLLQERMEGLRGDIGQVSGDLRTLTEKVGTINERLIRIETGMTIYERQAGQRRIEG